MAVSTKRFAIAATATAAIALIGIFQYSRKPVMDAFAACQTSQIMGGSAEIGGPFTLIDEDGQTVTDKDVLSKPSLVYFGYTFCPDVCPTDVARNAEAVDILEEKGYDVVPVFISVDPDRDTPAVLKEWTDYIHPKLIGLTGSQEQIRTVAKEYKTFYQIPEDKADGTYVVDHMTQTFLMLPDRGFADFYGRDEKPDDMADKVACFLEAEKTN